MSLVHHRKPLVAAAAAAAAAVETADVTDVSVVDDFQMRLPREVVEIRDEFVAPRKKSARVGAEAPCGPLVVDVGDERVPVVTQVELDVGFAGVTFVDAEQRVVPRITLEEAACSHTIRYEMNE